MGRVRCAAILFDMDGVLVDSREVVARVWKRWAAARGMDPDALLKTAQGRRTVDTLRGVAPTLDLAAESRWLDEAELDDREGIVGIPGAVELVRSLPADRWAVVTSAGRELARRRLRWAGLPVPERLVTAADVARGKPFPDGYLQAARALGTAPSDCLVVEDAPAGIEAARAAGMRVLGLSTTHPAHELRASETVLADLRGVTARVDDGVLVVTFPNPVSAGEAGGA